MDTERKNAYSRCAGKEKYKSSYGCCEWANGNGGLESVKSI